MSFNPRVQKKNNIKYSQSHTNALLNLAQTQAAETVILENMLQKRLDKISKAKKRSKRGFRIGKVLSKIIPGKLDDAILGVASSAYADRQRSKAYGGIDTSQVSLLKDAAIEIDSQAREMSDKLMKDMKFSANAGKLISKKMMDQIAELPEIKKLKDKFSSLPLKEQLKPKNLFDFLTGSAEVSANFMKNPVGFMKRYERDPVTKELQYKGTSALRKAFDSVIPAEKQRYFNEFNRLKKDAGLDDSVFSMLQRPSVGIPSEVDDFAGDMVVEEIPMTAADVVNAENEALEIMVDGTLLADIKDAMPGEVVDSAASPELNQILNELVEEEVKVKPERPLVGIPLEEPDMALDMSLTPAPERPSVPLLSGESDDIEGDMVIPGFEKAFGGGAFQTNITYDPETLQKIYGTSYMNYAVDALGDTTIVRTPERKSTNLGMSRTRAQFDYNTQPVNSLLSVTQPQGMSVDDVLSQFAGINEPLTLQQMFDNMSRRDQRRFRRNNPNMFRRK